MSLQGVRGVIIPRALQEDESLSSWIARVARASGYGLHQLASQLLAKRTHSVMAGDLDVRPHPALVDSIGSNGLLNSEQLGNSTLGSFHWMLTTKPFAAIGHLKWVLHRRRTTNYDRQGRWLQACPLCLAAGHEPHFRRAWRLSFFTECPIHRVNLIDRCHQCGQNLDYLSDRVRRRDRFLLLSHCLRCGADWRDAASACSSAVLLNWQIAVDLAFKEQWIGLGEERVLLPLYLDGVYALQKVLRSSSGAHLTSAIFGGHSEWVPARSFECLSVQARREIMSAVEILQRNWPDDFLRWSTRFKVRFGLQDGMCELPFWLAKVVRSRLSRAWHRVTAEEQAAAAGFLASRGIAPTAAAVRSWTGGWVKNSPFGDAHSLDEPLQMPLPGIEVVSDVARLRQHLVGTICARLRKYCEPAAARRLATLQRSELLAFASPR